MNILKRLEDGKHRAVFKTTAQKIVDMLSQQMKFSDKGVDYQIPLTRTNKDGKLFSYEPLKENIVKPSREFWQFELTNLRKK